MDDVRIFIDFWNLQLSIRDIDSDYRLDWKKIWGFEAEQDVRINPQIEQSLTNTCRPSRHRRMRIGP